ncbi:MAG: GGDEF domain-containing protein [Lachnospiraceae bacterium]|nr:GGDEF domain-containing protein [Lachnospiraceae bacterium]
MDEQRISGFDNYLSENHIRINKYLNIALWLFILTGPAIALGVKTGHFPDIKYSTCIYISVLVFILALAHLILIKKWPGSKINGLFALTALNIVIVYMSVSHVNIRLTWFLVPLLSLLFCNKAIFYYAIISNYVLMAVTTWVTAPYEFSYSNGYNSVKECFIDIIGGYTIETLILVAGSLMIANLTVDHFKELFKQYSTVARHETEMEEKIDLLDSMAEIYDNVNLVNFVDNTEMSLRNSDQKKVGIDMHSQSHTIMNQKLKNNVVPDQLESFLTFTNLKTVRSRLSQKKIISADFIDVVNGWFRAQYITVDATIDGIPNSVIYTTRNVDDEKRREEHLIRISMTDEMTRLFNRRCYEEDLTSYRQNGLDDTFVLFSVDVNGLKKINDSKGHAAGDELIKGAANCLAFAVGNIGKAYRTGGDEFMAIVHTDAPEKVRESILSKSGEWHGIYADKVTMSVGYAAHYLYKDATIDELEHLADQDMYAEKEKYYKENGIDRRR